MLARDIPKARAEADSAEAFAVAVASVEAVVVAADLEEADVVESIRI